MVDRVVNERELRVIGMSRSGNHAIIEWIIAQIMRADPRQRVCWLHCAEPTWNPFWTVRPFDDGARYRVNDARFDLQAEMHGDWSLKDWLIFNYEDTFLRSACSDVYEAKHDEWVGPSRRRQDVLILRDPFNLFASRRRALGGLAHVVQPHVGLRIWKQHARQFVEGPRMLRHDPVLIVYNRWCVDCEYRKAISTRLGVPFSDAGRQDVPAVVGGSSFDGRRYHGSAAAMRTDERWRYYSEDQDYLNLFDRKTVDFARSAGRESDPQRFVVNSKA